MEIIKTFLPASPNSMVELNKQKKALKNRYS